MGLPTVVMLTADSEKYRPAQSTEHQTQKIAGVQDIVSSCVSRKRMVLKNAEMVKLSGTFVK